MSSSSLLRSSFARRALSDGPSLHRAISAAAIRRGLAPPTMPRLAPPPYSSSSSGKKVNRQLDVNNIDDALDKVFLICGGIRILAEESKPHNLFVHWSLGFGYIIAMGAYGKALKAWLEPAKNNRP